MGNSIPPTTPQSPVIPPLGSDKKPQTNTTAVESIIKSDEPPKTPNTKLHERSISVPGAIDDLASLTKNSRATKPDIDQIQKNYESNIQKFRDMHAEKWLCDHCEAIQSILTNPKSHKKCPYKICVMINGERQQIIPKTNSLKGKDRELAMEFLQESFAKTVKTLPTQKQLAQKLNAAKEILNQNYNLLIKLDKPPLLRLEDDLFSSKFGIACKLGETPSISAYEVEDTGSGGKQKTKFDYDGFSIVPDSENIEDSH